MTNLDTFQSTLPLRLRRGSGLAMRWLVRLWLSMPPESA